MRFLLPILNNGILLFFQKRAAAKKRLLPTLSFAQSSLMTYGYKLEGWSQSRYITLSLKKLEGMFNDFLLGVKVTSQSPLFNSLQF